MSGHLDRILASPKGDALRVKAEGALRLIGNGPKSMRDALVVPPVFPAALAILCAVSAP